MARSYDDRFEGQQTQVLSDVKKYGYNQALQLHGGGDILCFTNWVTKKTQDEHYGDNPVIGLTLENQYSYWANVITHTLVTAEDKSRKAEARIMELERELAVYKRMNEERVYQESERILNLCQV